jgi:hypothetical protein
MAPAGIEENPLAREGHAEKSVQDQARRAYSIHPSRGYRAKDLKQEELVCRLCGKEEETQEHVMWRCCGSTYASLMIKDARKKLQDG